jgi:predicted metal-binding protein
VTYSGPWVEKLSKALQHTISQVVHACKPCPGRKVVKKVKIIIAKSKSDVIFQE